MANKAKNYEPKPLAQGKATVNKSAIASKSGFCYFDAEVLVLNVLGTPCAKRDVIGKPKADQLKISVTAEPSNGKASQHMVTFLAREFGVKTSQIELVYGLMNVNKQLRITKPQKLPKVIAESLALSEQGRN